MPRPAATLHRRAPLVDPEPSERPEEDEAASAEPGPQRFTGLIPGEGRRFAFKRPKGRLGMD